MPNVAPCLILNENPPASECITPEDPKVDVLSTSYGGNLALMELARLLSFPEYRDAFSSLLKDSIVSGATVISSDTFWLGRNVLSHEFERHASEFRDRLWIYFRLMKKVLKEIQENSSDIRGQIKTLLIHFGPQRDCYSDQTESEDELYQFHLARFQAIKESLLETDEMFASENLKREVLVESVPTFKEAKQIMLAARKLNLPIRLSFTLRPEDGKLFDGISIGEAIKRIDQASVGWGSFGLNCSSMFSINLALEDAEDKGVVNRIKIVYPNASEKPQVDLEKMLAEELGGVSVEIKERARDVIGLRGRYPNIEIIGECCGGTPDRVCKFCKEVKEVA